MDIYYELLSILRTKDAALHCNMYACLKSDSGHAISRIHLNLFSCLKLAAKYLVWAHRRF